MPQTRLAAARERKRLQLLKEQQDVGGGGLKNGPATKRTRGPFANITNSRAAVKEQRGQRGVKRAARRRKKFSVNEEDEEKDRSIETESKSDDGSEGRGRGGGGGGEDGVRDMSISPEKDRKFHGNQKENYLPPRRAKCDEEDANDPQTVVEYVNDIYLYLRKSETKHVVSSDYLSFQPQISSQMRTILIDWMVQIHLEFKCQEETLFLSINLLDRFLSKHQIARDRYQLVGCTALFVASKYNEIYPSEISDLIYYSDKAFGRNDIISMEKVMMKVLNFSLTVPTAYHFSQRFLRIAGGDALANHLANFLMELMMLEMNFLKYLPSMIAASSVYLALKLTKPQTIWNEELEHFTGYKATELEKALKDFVQILQSPNSQEKFIRRKYSLSRFHSVSKMDFRGILAEIVKSESFCKSLFRL